ncbi:MAG: discoidin domain-containing protein [Candidatus Firestonebacteria bacterium]
MNNKIFLLLTTIVILSISTSSIAQTSDINKDKKNIALNATVSTDSTLNKDTLPENAVDGITQDITKYWCSEKKRDHWFTVDFKKKSKFNAIKLYFPGDKKITEYVSKGYRLEYWDEANNKWRRIIVEDENTKIERNYSFPAITSTKIQIVFTEGPEDKMIRLSEIEVYGELLPE